jgi:hypothetical protein
MEHPHRTSAAILATGMLALSLTLGAQSAQPPPVPDVPLQPLAQQVRRVETALAFLGQPLSPADHQAINDATAMSGENEAVAQLHRILDPYVLATVRINPESRVSVQQGAARPELVQGGIRLFLVKVVNEGHVTAPLAVASPNIGRVFIPTRGAPEPPKVLTDVHVRERWADMTVYTDPPMRPRLSGLGVEYVILQVYSRDAGQ